MSLKRMVSFVLGLIAVCALAVPVAAGPKSKASSPQIRSKTTTTHGKASSAKGQSARPVKTTKTTGKPTTTKGSGATKAPKSGSTTTQKTHGNGAAKKAAPVTSASTSPTTSNTGSTTGSTTENTTTTPGTSTTWKPTNAVAEKLVTKRVQLDRALAVLPKGIDLNLATADFKNFGQFNATVNASQRLGIEFADLKAAMTGTTLKGDPTNAPILSLGQAIQKYKPGVNSEVEAQKATTQANLESTSTSTAVSTQPKHGRSR